MEVETLAIDDPRWPQALTRLHHDFYHVPDYVRLDGRRMDATPEAFAAQDGERVFFVPYLVRDCDPLADGAVTDVISPYGYPGILLSEAGRDRGFVAAALAAFRQNLAGRGACSAFLRMHPILSEGFEGLFPEGTFNDSSETVAIDLHLDEKTLWKQIRQGHQETLKKCQKLGFTARFVPLTETLEPFIAVYEETMDRVKAKESYYFGRDYFVSLATMPQVHCCVVENAGTIAAACLFFECGDIVQAHLGGTRTQYLSKSPFHMTLYQAMRWAKERGRRWLHLGGGVSGADDKLLSFKGGFSPVRFQFLTSRLVTDAHRYRQLVDRRAQALNLPAEALLESSFFPAYRSA
jgi:hypothetical protein